VQAAIAACTRALRNESLQAVDTEAEGGESDTVFGETEQALRETQLAEPLCKQLFAASTRALPSGFLQADEKKTEGGEAEQHKDGGQEKASGKKPFGRALVRAAFCC
jgi:hypothetical protein